MNMTEVLSAKIPFGRENAISRERLANELGITDRKVRRHIEKARAAGLMIVNSCDGKGYFQAENLDDIAEQYWKDTSRAIAVLTRRKPMREVLKAAGRTV